MMQINIKFNKIFNVLKLLAYGLIYGCFHQKIAKFE